MIIACAVYTLIGVAMIGVVFGMIAISVIRTERAGE